MSADEVSRIIEDKGTMEQIEKEIKQITEGNANTVSKNKNSKRTL